MVEGNRKHYKDDTDMVERFWYVCFMIELQNCIVFCYLLLLFCYILLFSPFHLCASTSSFYTSHHITSLHIISHHVISGHSAIDVALQAGYKELAGKLSLWSCIELRSQVMLLKLHRLILSCHVYYVKWHYVPCYANFTYV
jgi:hypothetical protein